MKQFIRLLIIFLLTGIVIVAIVLLRPVTYDVIVAPERPGTQYWHLASGSTIAYTHIQPNVDSNYSPIIYLHGGPGAGITNKEIQVLARLGEYGYHVYLYDQVGCGLSGRLENISEYSPQRHLNDLSEVITKLNTKKVILAGQSWGSILSLMYLAANPAKVEKLIITAPGNIQPLNQHLGSAAPPDSVTLRDHYIDRRYQLIEWNLRARAMIFAAKRLNKKISSDKEADALLTLLTTELNRSMVCDTANAVEAEGTEGFYSHYMTLQHLGEIPEQRSQLRNSHIPVLIMKGECDIQPWSNTNEYFDIFPQAEFHLIKNSGHNIFTEQPEEYTSVIGSFLRRNTYKH